MCWGGHPGSVNARLFFWWSTWDRLPCECVDPLKWMHFNSSVVTAQSWFAASQCIWVCWIFLEGWRGGSSALQVSQILMCLAGLAGGPGSRWADGRYPASHGQGLSSRLVRALRDQGPPSSDKKVRCVLGCLPGEASGSQRPGWGDLGASCGVVCGTLHHSERPECACLCGLRCSTLWSKCQVPRSPGKAWNVLYRVSWFRPKVLVRSGLQTLTEHLSWEAISIITNVWWIQVCILEGCEDT